MNSSSSKSQGNEGARGSRGEANEGAQDGTATNQQQPAADQEPDLRREDARGGGGIGSNSSRSRDRTDRM